MCLRRFMGTECNSAPSGAGHYTTFISFARKYGKDIDVDLRWKELVEFEGELIKSYGKHETIHG